MPSIGLVDSWLTGSLGDDGTNARVGCTQTLNIYRLSLNKDPLLLVDLPGYGFAR